MITNSNAYEFKFWLLSMPEHTIWSIKIKPGYNSIIIPDKFGEMYCGVITYKDKNKYRAVAELFYRSNKL